MVFHLFISHPPPPVPTPHTCANVQHASPPLTPPLCRYAADQLTWLVTRSLGSAPMDIMAKLQEDIDECDAKGGRNAAIDGDENVADWVSLVAAGRSKQDVEEVVLPLMQQA